MNRRNFIRSLLVTTTAAVSVGSSSALAVIGRPATPVSVAGVRRRRRRRYRRRVRRHMHLYALPYGCHNVVYRHGVKYYYCGGIWYRPAYSGTTVIYIVDEIEPGADTEVEFEEYVD